jgi:hypothetical protein
VEQIDPALSAGSNAHPMPVMRKKNIHHFQDLLVVINGKDVQGTVRFG